MKNELNAFDPSTEELVPPKIGRTERRKEGGKKVGKKKHKGEKERKGKKERRQEGREGWKKEEERKRERKKGRNRLQARGVFVEKNTRKSNASLPLTSVKKN